MRILLVIPPYNIEEFYPSYQAQLDYLDTSLVPGITPSLGIMYISSALKDEGHEVKLLDGGILDEDYMLRYIKKLEPELIGLQVTSPMSTRAIKFSKKVSRVTDLYVVVGGPHVQMTRTSMLEESENIDFCAVGDGEAILPELCKEIEKGKQEFETPGLIWTHDGDIHKNKPIPFYIDDLDNIPHPDRSAIQKGNYCPSIGFYRKKPITNLITTRGCKNNCSFCHEGVEQPRKRSVEDVISELRTIEERGFNEVIIYDQDFGSYKERAMEICERIIENEIDLYFGCNLRIDSYDRELVKGMREAGFWRVFYGIESGVQKNLDRINKGIDTEKSTKVVQESDELGLHVFGSFILGIPDETIPEANRTIQFAKDLPLTFAKFMPFTPWPGSNIWENPEEFGSLDKNPNKMSMNKINFVPSTMSKEALEGLIRKGYREFYLRPDYILKRLKQVRTYDDLKQNIKGTLGFLRA